MTKFFVIYIPLFLKKLKKTTFQNIYMTDGTSKKYGSACRSVTARDLRWESAPSSPRVNGKPDIHRVSKEELMQVPSIEEEMVERIIRHRPYTSASDLHWLFQVGDKRIEHLKEALRIPGEP